MPSLAQALGVRVDKMKRAAVERDYRMMELQLVRQGEAERLFPELFSDTWRKSVVSNWIESVALEFAEMIAPLPALNCSSRAMKTNADKAKAAKRNIIGSHYWRESRLKVHMVQLADAYLSFGFGVLMAEPDYQAKAPRIRVVPSVGTYYDTDRAGSVLRMAHCYRETVDRLAALFPELAPLIRTKVNDFGDREVCDGDSLVEVVQWVDDQRHMLFLPDRDDLVLVEYETLTKDCPVAVAERPNLWGETRGQYDQVIWVQLARHRLALLNLEAGVKAVGAPIAVPRDVAELAVGSDAVIVTDSPEKVRRVGIELPQSAFALQEVLESELRMGARYPEGRAGGIDASVVTGRGVEALMGSFDTQIQTAQTHIGEALARVTSFAFELDCKVWPAAQKRITGTRQGEPYDLTYTPGRDLEQTSCDVTYGFAAGLAPNAATVMMLQLRGDGIIDRSTLRKNLPFDIDDEQMQRALDVETTSDALKQGFFALLAGLGPMAAQGMDPRPYLRTAAEIIQGRQNGRDLHELFVEAFAPEVMDPEAAKAQAAQEQGADATGGAPGALPGQDPNTGLPSGTVPGQAGMPAGGAPDLQTLIAGMRGGEPQMDAAVSRRLPTA